MSKIKLVLADVDGTLVTHDKVLTDRAIAAVKKMREQGIGFAISSGRPPKGMQMLVGPLEMDEPVAGFNGGMFVSPERWWAIYDPSSGSPVCPHHRYRDAQVPRHHLWEARATACDDVQYLA